MLNFGSIPNDGEGNIILSQDEKGITYIPLDYFQSRFAGAQTLEEYVNHPNATDGWKAKFQEWDSLGYFN